MKKKQNPEKARFFLLHPACNPGKVLTLEAVHAEYLKYVRICILCMLDANALTLNTKNNKLLQAFFPPAENLTSQIEKNARKHAVIVVSSWAKSVYTRKLKNKVWLLLKDKEITEDFKRQLCTVGK